MKKFFIVLTLVLTACTTNQNKDLLLVSTTSTQDSGLLDVLLPAFESQSGYRVRLVATGSGQALKIGKQGNADVILLHSPDAEEEFMANGFGIDRRMVMHNDFVIVGPPSDPALILSQPEPVSAFEAIYASASTFVSRGDESGTHVKELAIWENAGLDPHGQSWYLETGQGQGNTLSIASEKGGYALVDRGTFLAYKTNLNLEILLEGDPFLLNVYHILTVNPEKWKGVNLEGARAFADFITSSKGQDIIAEFGVDEYGQPLFFPDTLK
ncbi:MAG TPA: substrate-binding domain-containing protein [Anaerolineales bacterium]|nr:substrate-binding domain-containing protein [Anaerolineales bacterium]